jgi:2-polyprenyl-3-methyl-5-hydroxy-6-metoxy-1,4-benzoquinol methylase
MTGRKSTQEYWDKEWQRIVTADKIDPTNMHPSNLIFREFDKDFRKLFGRLEVGKGASFIEIGCGGSLWLPYFDEHFGFRVAGIDYSDSGVDTAREIATRCGVNATITKGDAFADPMVTMGRQFDVVASFGLIEHFDDTHDVVEKISRFLKPGGVMLSLIPNMAGAYGSAYKLLKPEIYNIHKPVKLDELVRAHVAAGLNIVDFGYVLATPGVISAEHVVDRGLFGQVKRAARLVSNVAWSLEAKGIAPPKSQLLSPYLKCFARKPID